MSSFVKRSRRATIIGALSIAATVIATSGSAQAACFMGDAGLDGHRVASANKWGASKGKAQERARGSWNSRAQSLMGTSRANWSNAQFRDYYCHRGFGWHCTAYARPCI